MSYHLSQVSSRPLPPSSIDVPQAALRVLHAFEDAGYEAWIVGGWVRDMVRGAPVHDIDMCTNASWEQCEHCLDAAHIEVHETGIAHGTVTAVVQGEPIEVTTYRIDGTYSDFRHPDSVIFVDDIREDLARRDFTVNAMAWHPERGLLDPFGGCSDLARGCIRAVGNPAERFAEDALRVLRAVRFACRLGFYVEPATQAALERAAPELVYVARERVGAELRGIVNSGHAAWALRHETTVMCAALPELAPMRGFEQHSPYHSYDVLEHTARVVSGVEEMSGGVASERLRWAALLHDCGKPSCFTRDAHGRGHFFGHPHAGARMSEHIMHELALPHELARPTVALVRLHDRPFKPRAASLVKLMAELDRRSGGKTRSDTVILMHELLNLRRADALAKAPDCRDFAAELDTHERILWQIAHSRQCWRMSELAIGGTDVMRVCALKPGPAIGVYLRATLNAVMAGSVVNEHDALLDWVQTYDKAQQAERLVENSLEKSAIDSE